MRTSFKAALICSILVIFLGALSNNGCEKKDFDDCDGLPVDSCHVDSCIGDSCHNPCNSMTDTVCDAPSNHWQYLGLDSESVAAIAVHPCHSNIIYAGTLFDFSGGVDGKLFRSTDCGQTWDTLLRGGRSYRDIFFDPQNPDIIYALHQAAIMKSTDGGETWSSFTSGITTNFDTYLQCMAIDPKNPNILYAGTSGPGAGRTYKTTNGGANWIVTSSWDAINITVDPHNTQIIYAGEPFLGQIIKSTDGGATWDIKIATGYLPDVIALDPGLSNLVYVGFGGLGLYTSTNGGDTWDLVDTTKTFRNTADIAFGTSNEIYVATSYGFFMRANPGWVDMNEGFSNLIVADIAFESNKRNLFSGLARSINPNAGIYVRRIANN